MKNKTKEKQNGDHVPEIVITNLCSRKTAIVMILIEDNLILRPKNKKIPSASCCIYLCNCSLFCFLVDEKAPSLFIYYYLVLFYCFNVEKHKINWAFDMAWHERPWQHKSVANFPTFINNFVELMIFFRKWNGYIQLERREAFLWSFVFERAFKSV